MLPFFLFLVFTTNEREVALLKLLSQELVDGESNSLARGDTHDTRGDALVEGVETFLPRSLSASLILKKKYSNS